MTVSQPNKLCVHQSSSIVNNHHQTLSIVINLQWLWWMINTHWWQSTLLDDNQHSLMTINTHWWQSTLFDDNQNLLMTINIYWWWSTLIDDDHYSLMTIKCCYQSINYHLWELLSVYSLILINNESIKMKSSLSFSYHFFVDALPELFQCSMNKKNEWGKCLFHIDWGIHS